MKIINIKLIIVGLLMIGAATATQAQTNYWTGIGGSSNLAFNFNLMAPPNKYCADASSPLTDAEIDDIVRIHNETRHAVGTAPLKWNCDLAKFSQDWANLDTFAHSSNEQREQIIKGGAAGENLALDSGSTALMSALNKGWIDEKQSWDANKQVCAEGKVCGHYTQMVWKTSTEIGCGIIRNSKKLGEEFRASYFVCTYYPSGNVKDEKAH